MGLATAWRRRVAADLTRSWRHGGRRGRLGMASLGLCAVVGQLWNLP
jgi:hypothetical protein